MPVMEMTIDQAFNSWARSIDFGISDEYGPDAITIHVFNYSDVCDYCNAKGYKSPERVARRIMVNEVLQDAFADYVIERGPR